MVERKNKKWYGQMPSILNIEHKKQWLNKMVPMPSIETQKNQWLSTKTKMVWLNAIHPHLLNTKNNG